MELVWRRLVAFALCAVFVAAFAMVVSSNGAKKTFLSRMFDPESRDPDEPTEEEENARAWGRQYSFSQSSVVSSSIHDSDSGYNVQRMQRILNEIKADSGKYVQIDRQRNAIFASIKNLEAKARALTIARDDVKQEISHLTHKQQTIVDHLEGVNTIGHVYWYDHPGNTQPAEPAQPQPVESAPPTVAEFEPAPQNFAASSAAPEATREEAPAEPSTSGPVEQPPAVSPSEPSTEPPSGVEASSEPSTEQPSGVEASPNGAQEGQPTAEPAAPTSTEQPEAPAAESQQSEPEPPAVNDPYAAPPPAAEGEGSPPEANEGSLPEDNAVYDPYAIPPPPADGEPVPPPADETAQSEVSESGAPPAEQPLAARGGTAAMRQQAGRREARRPVPWEPATQTLQARERALPVARVVSVSRGPGGVQP